MFSSQTAEQIELYASMGKILAQRHLSPFYWDDTISNIIWMTITYHSILSKGYDDRE